MNRTVRTFEATGSANLCPRCLNPVFHAEQQIAGGHSWHRTCFTCSMCGIQLDSLRANYREGELFCKKCYGRTHGPRGYGFGLGAGTLSMTMACIQSDQVSEVLHNPKTLGHLDHRKGSEIPLEENPAMHPFNNMPMVKTCAHDNIITPNVPMTGLAHVYPRIKQEVVRKNPEFDPWSLNRNIPPNTISVVPMSDNKINPRR
ncbi:unnamed protein product [Notodromas monacha]|uniref:LIM zinc-binding domain-containing protein n=1 Tax=Notodromas monacha TaxID=399045 RepID=A0A7R9BHV0_9CRUS|nr:unnamed protein product [Notodromas monacha]CAG0914403.1 unnamed protein product [Notodromas monacha]